MHGPFYLILFKSYFIVPCYVNWLHKFSCIHQYNFNQLMHRKSNVFLHLIYTRKYTSDDFLYSTFKNMQ